MPDTQIYTREAARRKTALIITSLAASKLRLFQTGLTLTAFTTKEELEAAECDFDGYTAGGYTLAAWTGPINDPAGGAIETSPMVNVAYTPPEEDPPVGNSVGGWWVEDATGNVRIAGSFDPARVANQLGDGWPMVAQIVEGRNASFASVE